jgi:hypothetical protein
VFSDYLRDGSRAYHTPLAKAPQGLSQIYWIDADGVGHYSTSQEWMKWLLDETVTAKEKVTGTLLDASVVKAMAASLKAASKSTEEKEALDRAEKEAEKKVKRRGRPKRKTG